MTFLLKGFWEMGLAGVCICLYYNKQKEQMADKEMKTSMQQNIVLNVNILSKWKKTEWELENKFP